MQEASNMKTFTVIFICIQAFLVQNAYSQYIGCGGDFEDVIGLPEYLPPDFWPSTLPDNLNRSPFAYNALTRWRSIAPAAAAIAPGLGLASPLAYDGLAGWGGAIAPAGPFSYRAGLSELAYPGALGWAGEVIAPYGGVGEGNVEVAGELPVVGTTAVAGQVPIMGAVSFGGPVDAAGAVTITGQCTCGGPVEYLY